MWGSKHKRQASRIDTLIGKDTNLEGDLRFSGGLHIDGRVVGNVIAEDESVLMLSENGEVQGEVRVPHIILNGTVEGDVHASERIELAQHAKVTGNVFYNLIEMAMGAEVNGNLVHRAANAPAKAPQAIESKVESGSSSASAPKLAAQDNS